MFFLFFLVWIIFNGAVTVEIAIFGLGISAGMYAFICKFMNYSIKKDILYLKKGFRILQYMLVLVWEIVKANFAVIKLITSSRYELEPVLIRFKTDLRTKQARVALANSITLTPGTITVTLEEDEYVVHCLDKELAKGMNHSKFVELLEELERMWKSMVVTGEMTALETAYRTVYVGVLIFLALMIFFCLIRAVKGPRVADRIVAVNMIGTMVMVIIAILALLLNEGYLVDICLIYAMISFLAVIVLTKVYMGVHSENQVERKEFSAIHFKSVGTKPAKTDMGYKNAKGGTGNGNI